MTVLTPTRRAWSRTAADAGPDRPGADVPARPLRWLLIATHVPASGASGGMVRYTVELARALARRDDVELHVLARPDARDFFAGFLPAAQVWQAPSLPGLLSFAAERFALATPALRADMDVVHGPKHLLPRVSRGLQLLTVHDMLPIDRPGDFRFGKRLLLRQPYLESLRNADAIVCNSSATRERLRAVLPGPAARAAVVPLATAPDLMTATPVEMPTLRGRRFALVVGDASPRKNLATVVRAWTTVRARDPEAVLAVVGPAGWGVDNRGSDYEVLRSSGAVAHLSHVSTGELRWCYANARVVLCPSLLEGFGLPAREAADLDAPLITSEDPALCEVSGPDVRHLPAQDTSAWAAAILDMLALPRRPLHLASPRTWQDVASETVDAVEAVRRAR